MARNESRRLVQTATTSFHLNLIRLGRISWRIFIVLVERMGILSTCQITRATAASAADMSAASTACLAGSHRFSLCGRNDGIELLSLPLMNLLNLEPLLLEGEG